MEIHVNNKLNLLTLLVIEHKKRDFEGRFFMLFKGLENNFHF